MGRPRKIQLSAEALQEVEELTAEENNAKEAVAFPESEKAKLLALYEEMKVRRINSLGDIEVQIARLS